MEKVTRPLMAGFPARETRRHTWPGGYSDSQLKKAFTFKARPENQSVLVSITNSGAGHKVPTGDPDRFIDIEFSWEDESGQTEIVKKITFRRLVVWQPVIFDLTDNRLAAGETFSFNFTPKMEGKLKIKAIYNVMTERQFDGLVDNVGLTASKDIIRRTFVDQYIEVKQPDYSWLSIDLVKALKNLNIL